MESEVLQNFSYQSLVLTVLTALTFPAVAVSQEIEGPPQASRLDKATWNFQVENDMFASGDDRHYTNGVRFSYLAKASPCVSEVCLDGLIKDFASLVPGFGRGEEKRVSYSFGQNMYTPEDISLSGLQTNERPYAGWLYGGLGFVTKDTFRRTPSRIYNQIDSFEINIGIVGPASGAGFTQRAWHKIFDLQRPNGWANQLRNEPGIILTYERVWQFKRKARFIPMFETEFAPSVGAALGNVYTHAAAGFRIRMGANLPDDYGPPRIRPSLPGSDYFIPKVHNYGIYGFAGVEGRAVARNIFLDGNTFRDSHSVRKKHFVGDLQVGLALVGPEQGFLPPFRFSYTHILRSKEFKGQSRADQFGSFNLSFNF